MPINDLMANTSKHINRVEEESLKLVTQRLYNRHSQDC